MPLTPPSSGLDDEDFKPLTREQARQWRQSHPQVSPMAVLRLQGLVLAVATVLVWLLFANGLWAAEFLYGAAAVWLPTALMLWALMRQARQSLGQPQAALAGFFFWEGVKLVLAIAMMAMTPVWFASPTWLALMAGVMSALKAHWVVAWQLSVRVGREKVQ